MNVLTFVRLVYNLMIYCKYLFLLRVLWFLSNASYFDLFYPLIMIFYKDLLNIICNGIAGSANFHVINVCFQISIHFLFRSFHTGSWGVGVVIGPEVEYRINSKY